MSIVTASIDTDLEAGQKPLPPGKAIAYVPPSRGPVAPSTIFRWITKGCRGVRLEGRRAPNGWFTTLGAIQRFYHRLTELELSSKVDPEPTPEPRPARRRPLSPTLAVQHATAKASLAREGI